jgi:MFS family permease
MATGGPFFGWFSERIKSRRLPMMTGAFMASVFLSLVVFWKDVPPLGLEVLLFGAGFFIGCKTLGFTYICELVPHALNGTAVGFLNTICMLSGLMIQPLIGGLLTWQWEGQMADGFRAFTHGQYALALGAVPAAVFWSALLMRRLPETWRAHHVLHSDLEKGPSKERPTPH